MLIHRLLFGGLGGLILVLVLLNIHRKKLSTEFSLLWLLAALFLLAQLSPFPLIARLALLLHVQPLALVCIVFFLFVTLILFYYSVIISRLSNSTARLIQKLALLEDNARNPEDGAGRHPQL